MEVESQLNQVHREAVWAGEIIVSGRIMGSGFKFLSLTSCCVWILVGWGFVSSPDFQGPHLKRGRVPYLLAIGVQFVAKGWMRRFAVKQGLSFFSTVLFPVLSGWLFKSFMSYELSLVS